MLTPAAKNQAANAITVDTISLHSGAPGADGLANELPTAGAIYSRKAIAFGSADDGVRQQLADVLQDVPPGSTVSHYVLWEGTTAKKVGAYPQTETYTGQGQHKTKSGTITING
ncbi:MAG: hypothetical protein E6Q75_02430 [Rheinheimera sp.]|nr:MAG: hypothetical protein E6Q75_02430 [Rheinheimera sp.]